MNNLKKTTVMFLTVVMAFSMLMVPFTPITHVAPQIATPMVATPIDIKMDLQKYIDDRSIDGPLDSILTAYKETGIVPANVATNEEGAMGVLITLENTADMFGLDDIVDVNWKVDFGVATITSAYVRSVDEILSIENYDGVVTVFADSVYKETTKGVEPRPVFDVAPINSEPAAYATTEHIGADLVVIDGINGTGVRIGVIDTGTDFSSPDMVDAIDFGSDGLPTSYDPTGYGMGMTLYRVNLTTVDPAAWLSYSTWNILSFTENGKTYIDTTTYQHNSGSPYLNNQGSLYDLDFFIDAYLANWWNNAYPAQSNFTDYYYDVMRQPQEIPDPTTIAGGDAANITLNATSGEWELIPYACHGYVFQHRWDPYMKIFSNVLVVNSTKIIVDWNTTRAWTDFWNNNIHPWYQGDWDFNTTAAWDYYNALGDWSFADDLEAGHYYCADGTVEHSNMYHDYTDGARFGLGLLAHVWESNIFGLGMIDGIGLGGRVVGIMYDGNSHGTFVAAQIASRGRTQYPIGLNGTLEYLPGVAPNSTIMAVSTVGLASEFNSMLWAAGFDFNLGSGYWEWNSTSGHQMDITSNSWGWATPQYYELWGQYSLIYAAMATPGFFDSQYPGMLQCFSAGNSGPGYGTTTPPRAPQLINVGASTSYHTFENSYGPDQGFDQIASFSSRGPLTLGYAKPDVLAPGANNWGLVPSYGDTFGIPDSSLGYEVYSGTSMACPMVAGVAALLVEAYNVTNNEKARPDMIKTIIQCTADDIGMDALSQGHGVVNAWAAYGYIVNGTGNVFYTYDSTENWADATTEAWQSDMNPYDLDNYIDTSYPPTDFADGNLFFGLVQSGDSVTMTVEGFNGVQTDYTWSAVEYIEDTVTTFEFETYIYNETTSTGADTIKAGWFELSTELAGNYSNFAAAPYATIFITGAQADFGDDEMWAFVFDWDDNSTHGDIGYPDYYNTTTGWGDELTRWQYAGGSGNVLKMDLSHPDSLSNLFPNEGIVSVHDDNIWSWPYTNGNTLTVTVVTWEEVPATGFSFADNSGDCNVILTVPATNYGIHQGFILADDGVDVWKLPYTYNVYAIYDTEGSTLTLANSTSCSWNPYEPGVISAGWDSYYTTRSADHHSFVVNMTDATVNYLTVRLEWTNTDTDMDVAIVDMTGYEVAHSGDSVKATNTSALAIADIGGTAGMYIIYTTVNAMDGENMPENYNLTIIGFDVLDEPTLTLSWYSHSNTTMAEFESGDSIAGDHVIVNATWTDGTMPGMPEWKITSTEIKILYGVLFYEEGPMVHASNPGGVFAGIIDPDQFAWVTVPDLTAGDEARIICDFDTGDADIMMWPPSIPMEARTYANNIVDMATADHPETDTITLPEDGDYAVGILDYSSDGGDYYFTLDTRLGLEPARVYSNTIEIDTYYLLENRTYSILVDSDTGTNLRYSEVIPDVTIGNFFAPVVTVNALTPVAGDEERTFDVTWSSFDLNADDENYYSLWLSNNDGVSYMLIALNLTVTTYRWNSSGWLADSYMFRVRAYSLDFTVGDPAPDVSDPPAGYWPGDFADGFSSAFDAGDVIIEDTTPPTIDSPLDVEYESGATGYSISWTPYDLNPQSYSIYLDELVVRSGPWNSTSEIISISVEGLNVGIHNYTVIVTDQSSNWVHDTVFVTVIDTNLPIVSSPSDVEYESGATGYSISWTPYDLNPQSYSIYLDELVVRSGPWNSTSEIISISVEGLNVGIHNYTVIVTDQGSNSISDTVFVTVIDTTLPIVSSPLDVEYEYETTGHSINWLPYDLNPQSYSIYFDSIEIRNSLWNSNTEFVNISVDGLPVGVYIYTIVVYDTSGNCVSDTVLVSVVDVTTTTTTSTTTGTNTTSTTTTQEGFPTVLVIAIGVGVAFVVIIIIIIFLRKRGGVG